MESELGKLSKTGLLNTVIKGGYCVRCGACASLENSPMRMKLDEFSKMQAFVDNDEQLDKMNAALMSVCPFSDSSLNEDQIGESLYGNDAAYHDKLGFNIASYAGYVKEGNFRRNGSSGGMGSWIAFNLFKRGEVDSVIHVHQRIPTPDDARLFHYQLSETEESIFSGSKSRYYPIELSEMMSIIRQRPGKYAIIGIPCFIKSIRLLTLHDPILNDRIKFCIGLICGHIKSTRFAEMLSWECGIKPNELRGIDFRTKLPDLSANQYGVTIVGEVDGHIVEKVSPPVNKMYGTNWGHGFFKYKACDFCDDVVAETADVTVGDAWLPQYKNDSQGTNVIVVRNKLIANIINEGISSGQLSMDEIDAEEVVRSQKSGFDHRRDSLAFRLYLVDKKGEWRPKKRIKADGSRLSKNVQKRQILRIEMAERSHFAFNNALETGSFDTFKAEMDPVVSKYKKLYRPTLWKRILNKLSTLVK